MTISPHELGQAGEVAARQYAQSLGYTIVAHNVRAHCEQTATRRRRYRHTTTEDMPAGRITAELDIVARDGDTLVFIEVKTRRSTRYGAPSESISPQKLTKMRMAARYFLATHHLEYRAVRFDAICLQASPDGWILHHIKDIC